MARTKEFDPERALARAMVVFWRLGYEKASTETLMKAKAAGVRILIDPFTADQRTSCIVQFPGGYIAEIHSIISKPS